MMLRDHVFSSIIWLLFRNFKQTPSRLWVPPHTRILAGALTPTPPALLGVSWS